MKKIYLTILLILVITIGVYKYTYTPPIITPIQPGQLFFQYYNVNNATINISHKIQTQDSLEYSSKIAEGLNLHNYNLSIKNCNNKSGFKIIFCHQGYYLQKSLTKLTKRMTEVFSKKELAQLLFPQLLVGNNSAISAGMAIRFLHLDITELLAELHLIPGLKNSSAIKHFVDGWSFYNFSYYDADFDIRKICQKNFPTDLQNYCFWGAGKSLYHFHNVRKNALSTISGYTLDGYAFAEVLSDYNLKTATANKNNHGALAAMAIKKNYYLGKNKETSLDKKFMKCFNSHNHPKDCSEKTFYLSFL